MSIKSISNKKVLLRERKRHTAHRVASARYADPSRGGTRSHVQGGTQSQVWGIPSPRSGGVTQSQVWGGTQSQVQGLPHPMSRGYPISGPGVPGVPPII